MTRCISCGQRLPFFQMLRYGGYQIAVTCRSCGEKHELTFESKFLGISVNIGMVIIFMTLMNNIPYPGIAIYGMLLALFLFNTIFPIFAGFDGSDKPSNANKWVKISASLSLLGALYVGWNFLAPVELKETYEASVDGSDIDQVQADNVEIMFDGRVTTNWLTFNRTYEGKIVIEGFPYEFEVEKATAVIEFGFEERPEFYYEYEENAEIVEDYFGSVYANNNYDRISFNLKKLDVYYNATREG
ncbi:hypothetical protein CEY16_12855 [Halalkalibacillus sediminis]|uniref:Uncharacterized protein n=1 Tax=Halalkalibacillus sediminis TaxID=2018042 RepID=A0A2I0QQT7_9BACI|nr:hypothetical protein [Halalkalibacillus sediminis]PKR76702.1 hypothetical protein CEY16_12855 [Halalkalibacillus sediminis]